MKNLKYLSPYFFISMLMLSVIGCSKDDNGGVEMQEPEVTGPIVLNNEVNDFVWKGLNNIYLWNESVPNLANNRFSDQDEYFSFLNTYNTPENLFDALLYKKDEVDRFSFIVSDYIALENSFQGTSNSNGLDFRLVQLGDNGDVFAYVRYVANGSDAASKDIKRGDFFLTVNGQQLTTTNFRDLLFGANDTYTLGMAEVTNNGVALSNKEITLTKQVFTENPILINKVIEENGIKIGYLMYNNFISDFDDELNAAFAELKSQNIDELVLDLRYNPGGRVSSAVALASMITGQFKNQIFSKEIWNSAYQTFFENNSPGRIINLFSDKLLDNSPIESLNLTKVYILTTTGTASSSELVINGLDPYINVIQIGTNTTGKYTGSVTLYDSDNFGRDNANPNHNYALQPLVLKSTNANGVSDFDEGLAPDYTISYNTPNGGIAFGENILNLGELGDKEEPFLNKAISLITGTTIKQSSKKDIIGVSFTPIADTKDMTPIGKGMYKVIDTN